MGNDDINRHIGRSITHDGLRSRAMNRSDLSLTKKVVSQLFVLVRPRLDSFISTS